MEGPEMNDQFYAFWSSAWNVFNSNFWAALAGAFAGAVAASKFAARQERRDDLVRTVNETNAAISISYSACEAYLAHKTRLIDPLTQTYQNDVVAYSRSPSSGPVGSASINLNRIASNVGVVQCGALQELIFRIPSSTDIIRLVAILAHSNSTLNGDLTERNDLVHAMRLTDEGSRTALYFGAANENGYADKTYPNLVNSVSELTTDCIFFSWLICELLHEEGVKIREGRNWLPATVPIDFRQAILDGFIPDPKRYPAWKDLAAPLYASYSQQRGPDQPAQVGNRRQD
jgi:hypothetical protein